MTSTFEQPGKKIKADPPKEEGGQEGGKFTPPRLFLEYMKKKGIDDLTQILSAIRIYHPDVAKTKLAPEDLPIAEEILKLLLQRLQEIRLGEETIPGEYKRFWPTFRAVLESSPDRDGGLQELYKACAAYGEGGDYQFPLNQVSAASAVLSGGPLDKFLSLTLFLDVTLGHAVHARSMGVQRDLEAKETQWYIPDELLGDEKTMKWHNDNRNFDSFAMLPGSGVLLAEKTRGRSRVIFRLFRGIDGKYRIEDSLGNNLIYRTQGGIPLVTGPLGEGSYLLDPGTGKLIGGYRSDFGSTGRIIGPGGRYINEGEVEKRVLGAGKKGNPRLQIEGKTE